MTETRRCKRCTETPGLNVSRAFTSLDGVRYPERRRPCYSCGGEPDMPKPDGAAIIAAIKGRKGLRSKRPDDARSYFVWRLARFHGGADVTMPITASMEVHGDPWEPELDKLAEAVAQRVFGTRRAGSHRWGRALGYLQHDVPGLPDSAYSGGRVADQNKPLEELAELI